MTTRFSSESETLRKCNFPATPKWREWLRARLTPEFCGNQVLYRADEVEILAAQVADFAAEIGLGGEYNPVSSNTREERRGLQTR